MSSVFTILLLGLAGLLIGGAWSMYRQKSGTVPVIVLTLLGVLAAAAGVLRMIPDA